METCQSIFLAQSDTTIGFLCKDFTRLNHIKGRDVKQNAILTLDSLQKLKNHVRIPNKYKKEIRYLHKSTFIIHKKSYLKNPGIRLIKGKHAEFLSFFEGLYSTSANPHAKSFSLDFALKAAQIVVLDKRGLKELKPSKIYAINHHAKKRIR
ncbi:MAG: hypothetical protein K2I63_00225 [Helicobacter sp.]|nr:hypothetical protein [Helicobacter sp.]